jgi:hypothetical protein
VRQELRTLVHTRQWSYVLPGQEQRSGVMYCLGRSKAVELCTAWAELGTAWKQAEAVKEELGKYKAGSMDTRGLWTLGGYGH